MNRFSLQQWADQDRIRSAISQETWENNVGLIWGDEAVEILASPSIAQKQRVNSYVTVPAQKILDRYEFAREGAWLAYGCTIDGESAEVPYLKPLRPRLDFEKRKRIKYETPAGMPASPLLPKVTWRQGLKIAESNGLCDEYRDRMEQENRRRKEACLGFKPAAGDTVVPTGIDRGYYRWVISHPEIPVVITEGWKKALSLLDHGQVAIALRGVTCWHKKGSDELHEILKHFATPGRQIRICFDQDTKASTIKNVGWEIVRLGRTLEALGSNVSVVFWDPKLGKGIDDALFRQGEQMADAWLCQTLAIAPTFQEWLKSKRRQYLLRVWAYLESLDVQPERLSRGQYLPLLPMLLGGAIHIVDSAMGTGKTTQLQPWLKAGYFALILSPLNSLGKQTAEASGLPHRHDCGNDRDQQTAFRLLVLDANGVVCCIDSLARIQEFINEDTPLLLVLDECNQVLESLNTGGTLKSRQSEIMELFAKALKIAARNGAIVLSEANVNRRTLEQVQKLSGCQKVRLFKHQVERQPWHCDIATGDSSGFVSGLMNSIAEGKKVILTVSSQNGGEKIDRYIAEAFHGRKKVIRIDSKTNQKGVFNQFFINPDEYLKNLPELPDVLILSPSAKSGVSITVPGFDEVFGLFTCHYPAMWAQQLGRYRLPVPRYIYSPRFIPASSSDEGYCSVRQVQRVLNTNLAGYQRVFDLADAMDGDPPDDEIELIQSSQQEFYAQQVTSVGIQKQMPIECLTAILEGQGHVVSTSEVFSQREIKAHLKEIQKQLWREDAEIIAAAQPDFDVAEAHELLNSSELTTEKRWSAFKVIWRDEFPGVAFDDADECYAALTENFGKMRRGVLLQARAANLDSFKAIEAEQVQAILHLRIKLAHRLPGSFFRAALIRQIGLLDLLDGSPYQESDERIQAIKSNALHWAREIYRHFTISIAADQTGIEIANKLLKKLGLKAEQLRRVGGRGQQERIWGISDLCDPVRIRLLQAATRKLGGDIGAIATEYPASYYEAQDAGGGDPPPASENPDEPTNWDSEVEQDFEEAMGERFAWEVQT